MVSSEISDILYLHPPAIVISPMVMAVTVRWLAVRAPSRSIPEQMATGALSAPILPGGPMQRPSVEFDGTPILGQYEGSYFARNGVSRSGCAPPASIERCARLSAPERCEPAPPIPDNQPGDKHRP
jgi:hypothetical protein